MIAQIRTRVTALSNKLTDLMDHKPLAAAGVFAGVGAILGIVIGVGLA